MKSTIILLVGFVLVLSSCAESTKSNNSKAVAQETTTTTEPAKTGQAYVAAVPGEEPNALQLAMSLDDFSTLVAAINAAGVENAVVNTGPLTIFAPLNSAFAKLPAGTVESLVKPENKGKLGYILTNHVAPANYPMKQLKKEVKKGRKLYMASGKYLEVKREGDDIIVGGTKILKSVKVSNGWVHVIDDVLVPVD